MSVSIHDVRRAVKNTLCYCTHTRRTKHGVYGDTFDRAVAKLATKIGAGISKVTTLVRKLMQRGEVRYTGNRLVAVKNGKDKSRPAIDTRHIIAANKVITKAPKTKFELINEHYAALVEARDAERLEENLHRWSDLAVA